MPCVRAVLLWQIATFCFACRVCWFVVGLFRVVCNVVFDLVYRLGRFMLCGLECGDYCGYVLG